MATIYDVARRAGVSPATVSRVFNGVRVSEEKATAGAPCRRRAGLHAEPSRPGPAPAELRDHRVDHPRHREPVLHLTGPRGGRRRPGGGVLGGAVQLRRGPVQGDPVPGDRRERADERRDPGRRRRPERRPRPGEQRPPGRRRRPRTRRPRHRRCADRRAQRCPAGHPSPGRQGIPTDRLHHRAAGRGERHESPGGLVRCGGAARRRLGRITSTTPTTGSRAAGGRCRRCWTCRSHRTPCSPPTT